MGEYSQYAIITNCYSTGAIDVDGGGICGISCGVAGGRLVTVTNCYSTGLIAGNAGGIVGAVSKFVTISNCYSIGFISANAGGILGNTKGNTYTITNCYTVGDVSGSQGYIIGGSSSIPATCFSEDASGTAGQWTSANADTVLLGFPSPIVGTTWVDVSAGSPYELFTMGYTPYTVGNIDISGTPMLKRNFAASVAAGTPTAAAIVVGKSYTVLDISGATGSITMDADTGVISTTGATAPGTYTIYLRNTGSYNITEYQLTVTEGGGGTCCDRPTFKLGPGVGYDTYTDIRVGNILIETVQRRPLSYDQLMTIRKAQASKKNV